MLSVANRIIIHFDRDFKLGDVLNIRGVSQVILLLSILTLLLLRYRREEITTPEFLETLIFAG